MMITRRVAGWRNLGGFLLLMGIWGCADGGPPPMGPGGGPPRATVMIDGADFLANRFFHLDLPPDRPWTDHPDVPGRPAEGVIDPLSISIFRHVSVLTENDPVPDLYADFAVFIDTTGVFGGEFGTGSRLACSGSMWDEVWFEVLVDPQGSVRGVDLGMEFHDLDLLVVAYDVVDRATGALLYSVGDRIGRDENRRIDLHQDGDLYYRLKLLKGWRTEPDPHTWELAFRNVYSLQGEFIDPEWFEASLVLKAFLAEPTCDAGGIPWLAIFGLETADEGPDGQSGVLFDLQRGLLFFPEHMPRPFAMPAEVYAANVQGSYAFDWEQSLLPYYLQPELYDWRTNPQDTSVGNFRFEVTMAREDRSD